MEIIHPIPWPAPASRIAIIDKQPGDAVSQRPKAASVVSLDGFNNFGARAAGFLKRSRVKNALPVSDQTLLQLNRYANIASVLMEDAACRSRPADDWEDQRIWTVLKSLAKAIEAVSLSDNIGHANSEELRKTCAAILDQALAMQENLSDGTATHEITEGRPVLHMSDLATLDPATPPDIDDTQLAVIVKAVSDLLTAIQTDARFTSPAIANDVLRSMKIVDMGKRFHKELRRPVNWRAGVRWLQGRDAAHVLPKTGPRRYLKRGKPTGAVESQTTRSSRNDRVMEDYRQAVDPSGMLVSRDNGTHAQEGLHAFAGRLVTLAGWASGTALTIGGKALIHQVGGGGIAPFVTGAGRMLSDASRSLTRTYNPALPPLVKNAPECAQIAREFRIAREQHRCNLAAARQMLALEFSIDGIDAEARKKLCEERLTALHECAIRIQESTQALKTLELQYRGSVAHGRFQYYGKGWGGILDTISSAALVPVTVVLPKVGIAAQGAAAVVRLGAGYGDSKTAVRTAERMGMKYADASAVDLDVLSGAKEPDVVHIRKMEKMLRAQAAGQIQQRVAIVQSVMRHALAPLCDAAEMLEKRQHVLAQDQQVLPKAEQTRLKNIRGKIAGIGLDWERVADPMRWHEIDPQSATRKLLRKHVFAWWKRVCEQFSLPGSLFQQVIQRYAGNLHAFVSAGEATMMHDTLAIVHGPFDELPDAAKIADMTGMVAGGTVLGSTAGVVRHEKQFTRNIFMPPVADKDRWIVETPNGIKIDLTHTGTDHKRRYSRRQKAGMYGRATKRAMFSGPMSLWGLYHASKQRKGARLEVNEAPVLLQEIEKGAVDLRRALDLGKNAASATETSGFDELEIVVMAEQKSFGKAG